MGRSENKSPKPGPIRFVDSRAVMSNSFSCAPRPPRPLPSFASLRAARTWGSARSGIQTGRLKPRGQLGAPSPSWSDPRPDVPLGIGFRPEGGASLQATLRQPSPRRREKAGGLEENFFVEQILPEGLCCAPLHRHGDGVLPGAFCPTPAGAPFGRTLAWPRGLSPSPVSPRPRRGAIKGATLKYKPPGEPAYNPLDAAQPPLFTRPSPASLVTERRRWWRGGAEPPAPTLGIRVILPPALHCVQRKGPSARDSARQLPPLGCATPEVRLPGAAGSGSAAATTKGEKTFMTSPRTRYLVPRTLIKRGREPACPNGGLLVLTLHDCAKRARRGSGRPGASDWNERTEPASRAPRAEIRGGEPHDRAAWFRGPGGLVGIGLLPYPGPTAASCTGRPANFAGRRRHVPEAARGRRDGPWSFPHPEERRPTSGRPQWPRPKRCCGLAGSGSSHSLRIASLILKREKTLPTFWHGRSNPVTRDDPPTASSTCALLPGSAAEMPPGSALAALSPANPEVVSRAAGCIYSANRAPELLSHAEASRAVPEGGSLSRPQSGSSPSRPKGPGGNEFALRSPEAPAVGRRGFETPIMRVHISTLAVGPRGPRSGEGGPSRTASSPLQRP